MRATRNRLYGVTRIGGSNPSSSAIQQNSSLEGGCYMGKRKMGFEPERARGDRKAPVEVFVPSGDSLLARYLEEARVIERYKQNSGNPSSSAILIKKTLFPCAFFVLIPYGWLSCWGGVVRHRIML